MSRVTPVSEHSLWRKTIGSPLGWDRMDGSVAADVCIIGAGFSGLTAALELTEKGVSVVVLEAEEPGWGASGRNAGFVVPNIAKADPDRMRNLLGEARGQRLALAIGRAGARVFKTARRLGIDCDAVESGWIQPAAHPAMLGPLKQRFKQWQALGRPVEWLDQGGINKITGCDAFAGGWIDRSGGGIDPLKYLFGLCRVAKSLNARIFTQSQATGFKRAGGKWRVRTNAGDVSCDIVLVCANATSGALDKTMGASLMGLRIYQMATAPLSTDDAARLTPGRQPVSDTRNDIFTFRIDAGNRLITGGMPLYPWDDGAAMGQRMARRLARELGLAIVPEVEALWTGMAAVTSDFLPIIREIAPGAFSGIACNARGIATTNVLGRDLARLALHGNAGREKTAIPVRVPVPSPHRWFAPLATRAWLWWGRHNDHKAARSAEKNARVLSPC